jgi:TolA-binding protein
VQVSDTLATLQSELHQCETDYAAKERSEKPHSQLAQVRNKAETWQKRHLRIQNQVSKAQDRLTQQCQRLSEWEQETAELRQRLQHFEAENAAHPNPIQAAFRLDAGFGTANNMALLIEMGYEIYSKPFGSWLSGLLAKMSAARPGDWQTVGKNAEMLAWKSTPIEDFPYPLDLGYERFWQGQADGQPKLAFSGLLHFGSTPVTENLPAWFHDYNARQTIEAGNKETRQVFQAHHIKVRSLPAMRLQEHFALFCANFVRFAAHWLAEQCPQVPDGWQVSQSPKVKEQVKVGAHSPAYVQWYGKDCLVRFKERSIFVGRSFLVKRQIAIQLTLRI